MVLGKHTFWRIGGKKILSILISRQAGSPRPDFPHNIKIGCLNPFRGPKPPIPISSNLAPKQLSSRKGVSKAGTPLHLLSA